MKDRHMDRKLESGDLDCQQEKFSTPGGQQYIELNREAWLLHVDKQGGGIDGKQLDQRDRFS